MVPKILLLYYEAVAAQKWLTALAGQTATMAPVSNSNPAAAYVGKDGGAAKVSGHVDVMCVSAERARQPSST